MRARFRKLGQELVNHGVHRQCGSFEGRIEDLVLRLLRQLSSTFLRSFDLCVRLCVLARPRPTSPRPTRRCNILAAQNTILIVGQSKVVAPALARVHQDRISRVDLESAGTGSAGNATRGGRQ